MPNSAQERNSYEKYKLKGISFALVLVFVIGAFAGCGSQTENSGQTENSNNNENTPPHASGVESSNFQSPAPDSNNESESGTQATEIPSNPETVTEEAAGTVYYSEPNRIVLFYGDGEVTGEYTTVGYFDNTEEFRSAVENNPVLEGWGNKIVRISDGE
ncbi:hypothetical protein C823_002336 [Eubacterium plexicaudatum ASF492]|nr:hypothetical protein C823_002336 [Eubacterium plexicaudatum ASF492]